MIVGSLGGGSGAILAVVVVILVARVGYSMSRSRNRRRVNEPEPSWPSEDRSRSTNRYLSPTDERESQRDYGSAGNESGDAGRQLAVDGKASAPPSSRPAAEASESAAPEVEAAPGAGAAATTTGPAATTTGTAAAGPASTDDTVLDPILEIKGLTVTYGPKKAVDDISMKIARGEIFGLLGPNGAGKTSTLSAIEGLLKPRSGTVLLDGLDAARHPIEAKAKMGVQLQATSFQSELTVKQIVRLYAGLYGVRKSDGEITDDLHAIGLGSEAGKPFKQLSGGQQQRLSLFVAVIHEPALLLLDEPTSGLDPQSRRQLWSRIERIRKDGGSILLTTHSMEEAQAVCDRVAIIDHGSVLTTDAPQHLIEKHKDDPRVLAVSHGAVTLEDVFIGLTGSEIRE